MALAKKRRKSRDGIVVVSGEEDPLFRQCLEIWRMIFRENDGMEMSVSEARQHALDALSLRTGVILAYRIGRNALGMATGYALGGKLRGGDLTASPIINAFVEQEGYAALSSVYHLGVNGVLPPYRRRGIGTKLVEHRIALARKQGCEYLSLQARPGSQGQQNVERLTGPPIFEFNLEDSVAYVHRVPQPSTK